MSGASAISRLGGVPASRRIALEQATEAAVRDALKYVSPDRLMASYSKSCAAAHEAGHAVVIAAEGGHVRRIRIRRSRQAAARGLEGWIGETTEPTGWQLAPDMGADAYIRRARIMLAGLAGEIEGGHAVPGSSADEVIAAGELTKAAAEIAGGHPETIQGEALDDALATIRSNADIHRRLSRRLEQARRIEGPILRRVLAGVRPHQRPAVDDYARSIGQIGPSREQDGWGKWPT